MNALEHKELNQRVMQRLLFKCTALCSFRLAERLAMSLRKALLLKSERNFWSPRKFELIHPRPTLFVAQTNCFGASRRFRSGYSNFLNYILAKSWRCWRNPIVLACHKVTKIYILYSECHISLPMLRCWNAHTSAQCTYIKWTLLPSSSLTSPTTVHIMYNRVVVSSSIATLERVCSWRYEQPEKDFA